MHKKTKNNNPEAQLNPKIQSIRNKHKKNIKPEHSLVGYTPVSE